MQSVGRQVVLQLPQIFSASFLKLSVQRNIGAFRSKLNHEKSTLPMPWRHRSAVDKRT